MSSLVIIITLFFSFFLPPDQAFKEMEQEMLRDGLKLEQEGRIEDALILWEAAFNELDEPSFSIGREYIRIATENRLDEKYKMASSMYLWGLSAEEFPVHNKEVFENEIEMIKPITNKSTYRNWRKLLKDEDLRLLSRLYNFWVLMDPTPNTHFYNERLIEHWERIAYSRKTFLKNNNTVYGTDDRAIYFVKYGEPDQNRYGYLDVTRAKVENLCQVYRGCNAEVMFAEIFNLYDEPYFELWIYWSERENYEDNTLILFGESGTNRFSHIYAIDELIPARAFTLSNRYDRQALVAPGQNKLTPGQVMQFLYYQQLANKDKFFAKRFNQLDYTLSAGQVRQSKSQGQVYRTSTRAAAQQILTRAPDEVSTYEDEYFGMEMEAFHYRFIDENNIPLTVTFLESYPGYHFARDYAFNNQDSTENAQDDFVFEEVMNDYRLSHTAKVLNQDNELSHLETVSAGLVVDPTDEFPSSSVFTIPNPKFEEQKIVLSAVLENRNPDTSPRYDIPFDDEIRGYGKLNDVLPNPLDTKTDKLMMADLVFGYDLKTDSRYNVLFPFVVSNTKVIPQNEVLAVHLEIYNLDQGDDGLYRFKIEYQVTSPRKVKIFGRKPSGVGLTLDLVNDNPRFVEDLEIQTRELSPGDYKLELTIIDLLSNDRIRQKLDFVVSDE